MNKSLNKTLESNSIKYQLFGTLNMFDVVPDLVYLIFENNGKYYFLHSEDGLEIESFWEINDQNVLDSIVPLTLLNSNCMGNQNIFSVGDEVYVGYQENDEHYFIGTYDEFDEFIKNIKIEDNELAEYISNFQANIQLSRIKKYSLIDF